MKGEKYGLSATSRALLFLTGFFINYLFLETFLNYEMPS